MLRPTYLEGTYSEIYPDKARMSLLFKQFRFRATLVYVTPERRARSTKVASWATVWHMPMAPALTIRS